MRDYNCGGGCVALEEQVSLRGTGVRSSGSSIWTLLVDSIAILSVHGGIKHKLGEYIYGNTPERADCSKFSCIDRSRIDCSRVWVFTIASEVNAKFL